ncbi:AAA family ATPase [Fusobacterium simiae]|uniref:AAA family ATPase n=1 Tax=Fusobacterium simiae TaxID=855 RepID=A0ABT4DID6_FUSSI|nr:AAA family ATPase [Fusobacterium simiae]MCY7008352.1 AAA family ATPase [Fusobacterium simiae]
MKFHKKILIKLYMKDNANYEDALKYLTEYLYKYYKQKVIVIIDEYDTPIVDSYYGLTEDEILKTLDYFNIEYKLDEVKDWYDGYKFGNKEIKDFFDKSFIGKFLRNKDTIKVTFDFYDKKVKVKNLLE